MALYKAHRRNLWLRKIMTDMVPRSQQHGLRIITRPPEKLMSSILQACARITKVADDYLRAPERSSERLQALAKGIKHNQDFEILALDVVEYTVKDIDFGESGAGWHRIATRDLAQHQRFIRKAMPAISPLFGHDDQVSTADVRFAKAMIVHHEGALMMARDYLDNPDTDNGYLERMNLDILRDQAQEIALMWDIVGDYKGDHCDITITPDMIDGMDDMMGHMDFSKVNCAPQEMSHEGHGAHHAH